jgi:hypothetical protein
MAVITTAVAATVAAVATVGQAYAANKAAGQQQKMANIQNARERVQAVRAMRVRQRALEAQGVASGTAGGSAVTGAMGATASSTAGAIGFQGALLANAQQITNWNNMSTGFGALASVGSAISQYPSMFSGGGKLPASVPKPTMATVNTGSNFASTT